MLSVVMLIAAVLLSYLIGAFPTSYILTKFYKGLDIRSAGSGNAGATNVLRVAGKVPAVITLVVDILKGVFVVTFIAGFFYRFEENLVYEFYRPLLGFAAICGHIWPVYLKFRGGKGVATTLGVALGLAPKLLLPSVAIWTAVFMASGYVSLASVLAIFSFPILSAASGSSIYLTVFSAVIAGISIYKHRENIVRLVKGRESKTILFKPKVKS